jgi:hypothetical protein
LGLTASPASSPTITKPPRSRFLSNAEQKATIKPTLREPPTLAPLIGEPRPSAHASLDRARRIGGEINPRWYLHIAVEMPDARDETRHVYCGSRISDATGTETIMEAWVFAYGILFYVVAIRITLSAAPVLNERSWVRR